jgi:hypothetical protein
VTDVGDAVRWRVLVALARAVFDAGDAWAGGQPEPMPVLIPGAEGWATAALRRACLKGRRALDRDDVAGVLLALIEVGHAGRYPEIIKRWLATIDRVEGERPRRRARTKRARLAVRDEEMIAHLKTAPQSALESNGKAARWLLKHHPVERDGGGVLGKRQVVERLKKCGALGLITREVS